MKKPLLLLLFASLTATSAYAQQSNASNPPPSVEIIYKIQAKKNGFSIGGQGLSQWQINDGQYTLHNSAKATFFGKIQESGSVGELDASGLAPNRFTETRYRKEGTTTTFAREQKKIHFSEGSPSIKLPANAQDRASVVWQIATLARSHPEKFSVGSEWSSWVAGRRDAENWRFKVVGKENISTQMGEIACVHLSKAPPADSQEQQVDVWLAPGMEWYPVQIRFKDADGDFVEQTVEKLVRK
jgi:hypothetical protein